MLVRAAGLAKPGIVGDVDQQDGPVYRHGPGKPGEYDFIADLNSQAPIAPFQRVALFPRPEIPYLGDNFPQPGQPFSQRNVFSVWHQVGFVVFSDGFFLWADQVGAVEILYRFSPALKRGAANQVVGLRASNGFWSYIR